jgi:hypothetical protein
MNTALDPILDSTFDHSAQPQPVWPRPATQLPNAHLTWAEWAAKQTATGFSEYYGGAGRSAQMVPAQQRSVQHSVRYFDHHSSAPLVWPLAGTQLPNAHLTWAEWVEVQPSGTVARQPEKAASRRAA